jgi:hypothetical protein
MRGWALTRATPWAPQVLPGRVVAVRGGGVRGRGGATAAARTGYPLSAAQLDRLAAAGMGPLQRVQNRVSVWIGGAR